MEPWVISLLCIVLMLVLVLSGVHLAIGLLIAGSVGLVIIGGWNILVAQVSSIGYTATSSYSWAVMPLFILMGMFAANANMGRDAYEAGRMWVGGLHGGLAMATTAGIAVFGATTGSSAATAALFAKISFPEMIKNKYDKRLSAGVISAAAPIAAMIPPSIILAFFGIMADISIGKLLIAGIFPGILEAVAVMGLIYVRCRINPKLGPPSTEQITWKERLSKTAGILPIGVVFMFSIGGIFFGIFTPTEGAAMGAGGALIVSLALRRLSKQAFVSSVRESVIMSAMIFVTLIGGMLFARMLVIGGAVQGLADIVVGLQVSKHVIFFLIVIFLIILGMMMQPLIMCIVTVPPLLPALMALGYDPIWYGIIFAILTEIAVLTPPVAINLYITHGIIKEHVSLGDVTRGAVWFIGVYVLCVILIYIFPQIALFLPGQMMG